MKIINKLLSSYKNARLQTQKKAQVLLNTCLIIGIATLVLSTAMVLTQAYVVSVVCLCLFLFCLATIILIYKHQYYLASNLFLLLLFLTMFVAIKFDAYVDAYETYVFATLGLVLLIIGSLVGYTRIQLYSIMLLDILAIAVLYTMDILPQDNYVVSLLHIQNLVTSIIMIILGGSTGIILISIQKTLLSSVEKEKEETKRMLKITEVYTKKSLISIIADGKDPTTFIPLGKEIAVLFCDIRRFTTFSETMKPIDIISFLNSYFNRMNKVIQQHHGEIDKLIGDGIMASFASTKNAITSAYKMKIALQEYNKDRTSWKQVPLRTGIGIAYGAAIVGNIGSESKMDYTVIGDVVNASSRLESLTKHYGVDIITSEESLQFIDPSMSYRFLDNVKVKGKTRSIEIYEIFEHEPDWIKTKKINIIPDMKEAFQFYCKGEFKKAREIYIRLIKKIGPHQYRKKLCADPVLNFFKKRCENLYRLARKGLLDRQKWNGIYSFLSK